MECYTCLSLSGRKPLLSGSRIYGGKYWVVEHAHSAILGWLVVILKRHVESLHEIRKEEFKEFAEIQQKIIKLLKDQLDCQKEYVVCFAEGEHFHHIHFHHIAIPKDLSNDFRGPKIFILLKQDLLLEKDIVKFCNKLKRYW